MKQLIYQLLPRLWGNGRFSGIDTESLRYIKDTLGMDYLWCMPRAGETSPRKW